MANSRGRRYTIYDRMEDVGVFDSNPANIGSRDHTTQESLYKGPVPYPKMFYHPQGAMRVVVPAEIIVTPMGPKAVCEQRELVNEVANNAAEAARLVADGWHDHPAKALACNAEWAAKNGDRAAPVASPAARIAELEAQILALQASRDEASAEQLAGLRAGGSIIIPPQVVPNEEGDEA